MREQSGSRHKPPHNTTSTRALRALLCTSLSLGLVWGIQHTTLSWQPGSAAAAPAVAKPAPAAATWRDVPPMPRYKPLIFQGGQLPKGLLPGQARKTPRPPSYRPLPPATPGKVLVLPPTMPNAKALGLASKIGEHYNAAGRGLRMLIQTDKPIYKPGEMIWFRVAEYSAKGQGKVRSNQPLAGKYHIHCTLYNPRGAKVKTYKALLQNGHSHAFFGLARGAVGGTYTIKVHNPITQSKLARSIVVNQYQAPRIKKKLIFLRKGYGAGDNVEATVELHRATGAILANKPLSLVAKLQGKTIRRWRAKTNKKGLALLQFRLPKTLATDDGQLTVMIADGGVTESISRPIPLAIKQIKVGFFPEGGHAVSGLSSRFYFAARRKIDEKPIDLAGHIKDQSGKTVAAFRSFHDGMGRFRFTPKAGNRYALHVTQPKGITKTFALPPAKASGVTLQMLDDYRSQRKKLRFVLSSKKPQRVSITALQHEQLIGHKAATLKEGEQAIALPLQWQARGIVRVTVWDENLQPIADRLVFRHRDRGLRIKITPNQKQYAPRNAVALTLEVTDATGAPVRNAVVGVSVVDDTVLSYADDHEPNWLAQRFLSTQLAGKIHKPNYFFDKKKTKSWRGLDLVMGTHGWQGFSWQEVAQGKRPLRRVSYSEWRSANVAHFMRSTPKAKAAFIKKNAKSYPQPKLLSVSEVRAFLARKNTADTTLVASATKASSGKKKTKTRPKPVAKPVIVQAARVVKKLPAKREQDLEDAKNDGAKKIAPLRPGKAAEKLQRGGDKAARKFANKKIVFKQKKRAVRAKDRAADANLRLEKLRKAPRNDARGGLDDAPAAAPARAPRNMRRARRFGAPQAINGRFRGFRRGPRRWRGRRRLRVQNAQPLIHRARRQRIARIRRKRQIRYVRWNNWRRTYQRRFAKALNSRTQYKRAFPTRFYRRQQRPTRRTDFRDTVYWGPHVGTNAQGIAKVRFGLNDSISSFRVRVSGVGVGQLGMAEHVIASKRPFFMVVKSPIAVSADDAMALPLTLRNDTKRTLTLKVNAQVSKALKLLENPLPSTLTLAAGEARTYFYPVRATAKRGVGTVYFSAKAEGIQDSFQQKVQVQPRGFPRHFIKAGELANNRPLVMEIPLPKDIGSAAPDGEIMLIPAPSGGLMKGLEGMIRMPHGCFEQTSSTNYPNVMILGYLKSRKQDAPKLRQKAMAYLAKGYQRLTGYETKVKGFEWFGRSPGHEALSAYGLMQFVQMKKVYPSVSKTMIQRTRRWLLSRRDGKGGYTRSTTALDSFGRASSTITNAYITYALTEAAYTDLPKELAWLKGVAKGSKDPYILSLALNAFVNAKRKADTKMAMKSLLSRQRKDGGFQGTESSITRSGGKNLHVETTSLAILGLLKANAPLNNISKAMKWLRKQRKYGRFGSTQATILALQAIIAYEHRSRRPRAPGTIALSVNGKIVAERAFTKQQTAPIAFRKFRRFLQPGNNKVRLLLRSKHAIPYSVGLRYFTRQPVSTKGVTVAIQARLQKTKARMGETVRLAVTIQNKTRKGLPMVLARVRYPGALAPQLWQLKQLREQKKVDFIETRPREVILYFSAMAPAAKHEINLDLVARVTGNYNAAASSAYLYYTDDKKAWSQPLQISVRP